MLHLGKPIKEDVIDEMIKVCEIDSKGDFDYAKFGHILFEN